ncbi:MAG TPA: OmpA family protein [Candidatus Barnesiella excrementavium]|nr:OmpA family protein [Candidatus Barnesiella excrementavium]
MNRKAGMVLLLGVASVFPAEVAAQNIFQKAANTISSWFSTDEKKTDVPAQHIDITQLTLDENISIPELDGKEARKIRAAQSREMKRLRKARLTHLELIRNYEVIKATLAASNLFLPNDTVLSDKADLFLRPFLSDLRIPDYYHVMLVMHSDDTGSEAYCLDLTRARAQAVRNWFAGHGGNTDCMVLYEAGPFAPVASNATMEGRAQNRRLDIYLIPGEKMIDMARRGQLDKR